MGSRSVCFNFTPGENEQIETVIVIPEERRSIIHGIVKNHCHKVVKDAVVKLYESVVCHGEHILKPLTHTFTDECGQFVFGPLWPCKNYVIKVWVNDVKIRELVIKPEECDCSSKPHHVSVEAEVEEEVVADEKEEEQEVYNPFEEFDKIVKQNQAIKIQSEDSIEQDNIPAEFLKEVEKFEDVDNLDE